MRPSNLTILIAAASVSSTTVLARPEPEPATAAPVQASTTALSTVLGPTTTKTQTLTTTIHITRISPSAASNNKPLGVSKNAIPSSSAGTSLLSLPGSRGNKLTLYSIAGTVITAVLTGSSNPGTSIVLLGALGSLNLALAAPVPAEKEPTQTVPSTPYTGLGGSIPSEEPVNLLLHPPCMTPICDDDEVSGCFINEGFVACPTERRMRRGEVDGLPESEIGVQWMPYVRKGGKTEEKRDGNGDDQPIGFCGVM